MLVRRAEMNDKSSIGTSDDASIAAPPTVNMKIYDDDRAITGMAAPYGFDVIFCGREDGSVAAYSALTGDLLQKLASHAKNIAVMVLHLSRSGNILVCVDRSGRIVARRLEILQGPRVTDSACVMDRKAIDMVEQVLVSGDDTKILVSMSHKDDIWEIGTAKTLHEIPISNDRAQWHWAQTSKLLMPLVYFSNGIATLYNWDLFEASRSGPSMDLCLAEAGTIVVVAVTFSANASHLHILLADPRPGLLPPSLRVWNMHGTHAVSRDEPDTKEESIQDAMPTKTPANATYDQLAKDIKLVNGVYEVSLIFLSHEGLICSLELTSPREKPTTPATSSYRSGTTTALAH